MRSPRALLLHQARNNTAELQALVRSEGCEVDEAPINPQMPSVPARGYCLVLFDIERPTERLLEFFRAWRDEAPDASLVVIGGRTSQANRIAVLETGVSAYLTKPVVIPELAARIRAALRRSRSQETRLRQVPFGAGVIDLEARLFRSPQVDVHLTPTECSILEHLATHMNQTVQPSDLVRMLWGADPQKGVHSLRLFIRKLRQKLEPDPTHPIYLVTDPTIGYRLQQPSEVLPDSIER